MRLNATARFVIFLVFLTGCASVPVGLRSSPPNRGLLQDIARIAHDANCRIGISAIHLETGRRVDWNESEKFESASVIKIAILVEALSRWQEGKLDLAERWTLTDKAKAAGSGVLEAFQPGLMPTNLDLLRLMIIVSDNTATNHWIDVFGAQAVNSRMNSLGFPDIRLIGRIPDRDPRETEEERWKGLNLGQVTPKQVAEYYVQLVNGKLLGPEATKTARQIFSEQHSLGRIPRKLLTGPDTNWEGKTGTLGYSILDSGLLTTPRGRYAIAIFADRLADDVEADDAAIRAMGDIAFLIVSAWEK